MRTGIHPVLMRATREGTASPALGAPCFRWGSTDDARWRIGLASRSCLPSALLRSGTRGYSS